MSKVKNWTYVFDATVWKMLPGDGWDIPDHWGAPTHIKCSYKGESKIFIDSKGHELTSTMTFGTEHGEADENDMIALGVHTEIKPVHGAKKIRAISRTNDLFYKEADDYKIVT